MFNNSLRKELTCESLKMIFNIHLLSSNVNLHTLKFLTVIALI